jgi:hypothetical protein
VRNFRCGSPSIFNEIAGNFKEDDPEILPLINALIALDNFLIDNAVPPSYHVYMVCEKTEKPVPMQTRNILPAAAAVSPTRNLEPLAISPTPSGSIAAEPNPFQAGSQGLGHTTLSWMTYGLSMVEVRVDAPDDPVFARSGAGRFGSKTGQWVRDGTKFYLQNVSHGLPLTHENTIAMVTLKSG